MLAESFLHGDACEGRVGGWWTARPRKQGRRLPGAHSTILTPACSAFRHLAPSAARRARNASAKGLKEAVRFHNCQETKTL